MSAITGKILVACWWILVIVWCVSALQTKRIAEKQSLPSALAHRIPVGLGCWLLFYPRWPQPLNWQVIPRTAFSKIIGTAVCVLGLLFTLWARHTLAGNWSSDVTFKCDHELIRTGPYRIVRHPIYTGLLLMCLGTAIFIGQVHDGIGLLVIGIGFWIKINQEERLLLRHFPDAYPVYQREVKALVPFVI